MSPNLEMTWLPNNSCTAAIDYLIRCAMSPHPVETRLREVVENCSVQVQLKIAASQCTHFKSSCFFVSPCINIGSFAFCWFVLFYYMTMRCAKKHKIFISVCTRRQDEKVSVIRHQKNGKIAV